jgi:hypothetical protein
MKSVRLTRFFDQAEMKVQHARELRSGRKVAEFEVTTSGGVWVTARGTA